jgi:hypothetical protein
MMRLRPIGALLLTATAMSSCDHDCTLIGCIQGVVVSVPFEISVPYKIEVFKPEGEALTLLQALECPTQACGIVVHIPDTTLARVIVRVTTPVGTRETDFPDLEYSRNYPNGPDCGPRCVSAQIVAPLPAPSPRGD